MITKRLLMLFCRSEKGSIQVFDLGADGQQLNKVTTVTLQSMVKDASRIAQVWPLFFCYLLFVKKMVFDLFGGGQILFPLQYKSCCIRRHAGLFSKTCFDYKTCHTIYSKTRLKYRTQQPSVDVTMTSSLLSSNERWFKTRVQ